jgi:hypothetical protein
MRLSMSEDYVTRDSGERQEYDSGMVRDLQEGKPRFDLLIPLDVPYEAQFLTRCAGLMTRGGVKYGMRNWEKADSREELERFRSSAYRHLMQWLTGAGDGEDHAAAVVFNLLAAETIAWKIGADAEPGFNLDLPAIRRISEALKGVR